MAVLPLNSPLTSSHGGERHVNWEQVFFDPRQRTATDLLWGSKLDAGGKVGGRPLLIDENLPSSGKGKGSQSAWSHPGAVGIS